MLYRLAGVALTTGEVIEENTARAPTVRSQISPVPGAGPEAREAGHRFSITRLIPRSSTPGAGWWWGSR